MIRLIRRQWHIDRQQIWRSTIAMLYAPWSHGPELLTVLARLQALICTRSRDDERRLSGSSYIIEQHNRTELSPIAIGVILNKRFLIERTCKCLSSQHRRFEDSSSSFVNQSSWCVSKSVFALEPSNLIYVTELAAWPSCTNCGLQCAWCVEIASWNIEILLIFW